jgi:hypothetical protein
MSPPLPAEAFRRWCEGSLPAQAAAINEQTQRMLSIGGPYNAAGALDAPLTAVG